MYVITFKSVRNYFEGNVSFKHALKSATKSVKRAKRGYGECAIVLILEQNIVAKIDSLNEYGHRLTFEIIYYVKYYGKYSL